MDAHNVPWWIRKEPNFSRLQASICRREVILGRDTILKVDTREDQKGGES